MARSYKVNRVCTKCNKSYFGGLASKICPSCVKEKQRFKVLHKYYEKKGKDTNIVKVREFEENLPPNYAGDFSLQTQLMRDFIFKRI